MSENMLAGANIIFPECIICLSPLQSELVTPSLCGHVFHSDCLRNWRNKGNNDKCPICKRDCSHTIKLIYDIKYNTEENTNQEPKTLTELLMLKQTLEKKNKKYENEIKELTDLNEKFQNQVEKFIKQVEENTKNMAKYKNEYLNIKYLLDQEKEKNQKNKEDINKLINEKNILENFKKRFELKHEIEQETEKIISNSDIEKIQENFETQFYKLLNDDDEKKGLREYFYVLQQKIMKLTQENEELKKEKKNFVNNYNYGFNNPNTTYTQLMQLTSGTNKRNYIDYLKETNINKNKSNEDNNINDKDKANNNQGLNLILDEKPENKRQINSIKLKKDNHENVQKEFRKLFNNPLKNNHLAFKNK